MANQSYIDKVLNSMEGMERAEPKPFFTGRVMQKLQHAQELHSGTIRLAWTISVAVILIALNLIIFFTQFRSTDPATADWKSTTPAWVVDYAENPGISIYEVTEK